MTWFKKEFIFTSTVVSFHSILMYAIIDIAEYQVAIRSKKLPQYHSLKKDHFYAINEEFEHAKMHTELLSIYGVKFFQFKVLRFFYKKIFSKMSPLIFWTTSSWFELFNSYFWIDNKHNLELNDYNNLSFYKKNLLWHYAEEASHSHAFWEHYEKSTSNNQKTKDSFVFFKSMILLSFIILISISLTKPLKLFYFLPSFLDYIKYILIIKRKSIISKEERMNIVNQAKEDASIILKNTKLKRVYQPV